MVQPVAQFYHSADCGINTRKVVHPSLRTFLKQAKSSNIENQQRKGRRTLRPGPCGLRAGLAAQGGGHNLRGKVEEVSQVLDTFIGEVPIKMTPGKLLLDIPTRLQRLKEKHTTSSYIIWLNMCQRPALSSSHRNIHMKWSNQSSSSFL